IKVKVLNGSGTPGRASEVKDLLKEKGYEEILTGNAESFDYTTTEIQVKKDAKDIESTIIDDLKDNTSKPKVSELDEKEASDVI
ncbi:LytR C-terminal domain-containing protein, partial [Staphylococcus aureus]|uniref:LytR C-terminal domain-containing protein n=1 Tax=Staphylococcus aureus TaxID=1280 RepID=UPI001E53CC66